MLFTRVLVRDIGGAGITAGVAIGVIRHILFTHAVAIGEHTRRASVIGMKVTRRATTHLLDGNPLTTRENHLGTGEWRCDAFADIELANIRCPGHQTAIIHRLFNASSIAIVVKRRGLRRGDPATTTARAPAIRIRPCVKRVILLWGEDLMDDGSIESCLREKVKSMKTDQAGLSWGGKKRMCSSTSYDQRRLWIKHDKHICTRMGGKSQVK